MVWIMDILGSMPIICYCMINRLIACFSEENAISRHRTLRLAWQYHTAPIPYQYRRKMLRIARQYHTANTIPHHRKPSAQADMTHPPQGTCMHTITERTPASTPLHHLAHACIHSQNAPDRGWWCAWQSHCPLAHYSHSPHNTRAHCTAQNAPDRGWWCAWQCPWPNTLKPQPRPRQTRRTAPLHPPLSCSCRCQNLAGSCGYA